MLARFGFYVANVCNNYNHVFIDGTQGGETISWRGTISPPDPWDNEGMFKVSWC